MQLPEPAREAGVIVPVYRAQDGALHLLLLRRSSRGIHGGQIALPGGKREPGDASILHTALRETHEEIGIAAECIQILADLPPADTLTTGFTVHPFLGKIMNASGCRPAEEEVEEIFHVPVAELAKPEAHGRGLQEFLTWPEPREVPFIRLGAHRIWGLTYRILHPLIPRLLAGEWNL